VIGHEKYAAEVAVIGGGPAGLVSAIALTAAGVDTLLIAPPVRPDHRTTALLAGSVTALETLGVWQACLPQAAPLKKLRIVDDTRRLVRAPELFFDAAEIGLEAFGYNIENRYLIAALEARAAALKIPRIFGIAFEIASDTDGVTVKHGATAKLADGEARVRLAIGADGHRSLCRTAAGIGSSQHNYPQTALTLNLAHTRPHGDIATEFHTENGPFTLVPLPGNRSSLVCVVDPDHAKTLAATDDAELAGEIERRAHSLLGAMTIEPGRGMFPLSVETAAAFARHRIALVGEAAHLLPPIGAQGLNLGLRDGATIAELVADARRQNSDVGGPEVLANYDTQRRADVKSCTFVVDFLNRVLLTDFMPAQAARGASLYLVDHIAPFRRALMRKGVTPALSQPRLMRGEMV
jgi:2-octaprenyl-6-methoxyphenol hydroxylase